jgi:hypothetical protein
VCGDAVQGGRSAWCPSGSAPAVRTRASHGRGAGVSSIGSCILSVCIPFAATSAAIGSGASASAGARTLGASRPWPEGARPLLVLSSSPAAAGVLGSVVYLGRHGEGVFEDCQPPRSGVLTDARAAYDTAPRRSIGYHPPGVSYPVAPPACGPHSRRRWMSLAASHAGAALPYRDSPLRSPQRSMASPCSPPEVSGNRPRGWRPSRRTSDRWYRPHSQVHRDGNTPMGRKSCHAFLSSCHPSRNPQDVDPYKQGDGRAAHDDRMSSADIGPQGSG